MADSRNGFPTRRPEATGAVRRPRPLTQPPWRNSFAGRGAIVAVQPAWSTDKTLAGASIGHRKPGRKAASTARRGNTAAGRPAPRLRPPQLRPIDDTAPGRDAPGVRRGRLPLRWSCMEPGMNPAKQLRTRTMRIFILMLMFGLAAWASPTPAQATARVIQCEDCTVPQMRSRALSQGQGAGLSGTYYVFSLKKQLMLGFWVQYEPDVRRWSASSTEVQDGVVDMFAHMLNAYELKPNVFVGQQVFRGNIGDIGGTHDPVGISIRGPNDGAYGRFMDNLQSCMAVTACVRGISPALAQLNLAENKAKSFTWSLFRIIGGGFSWQSTPPTVTLRLCNQNNDCAIVKYKNGEWVFVETRAEGGTGMKYPKNPEYAEYDFANSGEAGIIERGLTEAGAAVIGNWNLRSVLACTSTGVTTRCEYLVVPQ
ncbi:hypothetical protein H0E84_12440 [Luteimonas sp. SJ-92]|uniref:Uncharacterized protein n=1 Tax=Luteimonas salinisoli TaxID=2752307 RepID=A0A853JF69_9GAMM|nr:hypothetical protein [Luteimonas salinisoli]NZA27190.1 hypothetical protein [Luteimonas salinisoli]